MCRDDTALPIRREEGVESAFWGFMGEIDGVVEKGKGKGGHMYMCKVYVCVCIKE